MYLNEQNYVFIEYFYIFNEYLKLKSAKIGLKVSSLTNFLSDKKVKFGVNSRKKDGVSF